MQSTFTSILITSQLVEGPITDLGAIVAKAMAPGHRHRYVQKGKFTLADGTEVETSFRGTMKLTIMHVPELGAFPWAWQLRDAAGQLCAGGYDASEAEARAAALVTQNAIAEQDREEAA